MNDLIGKTIKEVVLSDEFWPDEHLPKQDTALIFLLFTDGTKLWLSAYESDQGPYVKGIVQAQ